MKKVFAMAKSNYHKFITLSMMACTTAIMTVNAFAATEDYVVMEAGDLDVLLSAAKDNIAVIIPVGVGLLAISFGIGYALSTLKKFKKG